MIRIKETAPPLDYSFKNLENIESLQMMRPRRGVKRYRRTSSGRYACTSLRLNNNHLTTVHGIHGVAYQVQPPSRIIRPLLSSKLKITFKILFRESSSLRYSENPQKAKVWEDVSTCRLTLKPTTALHKEVNGHIFKHFSLE